MIFAPNTMTTGINYWASHAATKMWTQWDEDVVRKDFKAIAELGCEFVRVFPKWDDFQPVMVLRSNCHPGGFPHAYAFSGERPFPHTEAGRAGVDESMMEHFETLADIAQENHLKLIVPLINGHMTFRVYNPPAVDGKEHFTDPASLMWQIKFVSYFVKRMKNHPAIAAWELGNESNCLSLATTRAAAWNWTASIVNAVRAQDSSRPVYSGMHSLQWSEARFNRNNSSSWMLSDQTELCDALTTHPYGMWRPYVNCDPMNTLRWELLAPTENLLYSSASGKMSFIEEIGTLRRSFSTFEALGNFLRAVLWITWASDGRALLWWCAFDQTGMEFPPYDWDEAGMEHGVFTADGKINPTGRALRDFAALQQRLGHPALPPPLRTAVAIPGKDCDIQQTALSVNIPAAQAGIQLRFSHFDSPIPESSLFLLPNLCKKGGLNRAAWRSLSQKVHDGATVYASFGWNVNVPDMDSFFGLEIESRQSNSAPVNIHIPGLPAFSVTPQFTFHAVSRGATPLDPAQTVWEFRVGKGRVITILMPIEQMLLGQPNSYSTLPFYRFYEWLGNNILPDRKLLFDDPDVIAYERENGYTVICSCSPSTKNLKLHKAPAHLIVHSDSPDVQYANGILHLPGNAGALLIAAQS